MYNLGILKSDLAKLTNLKLLCKKKYLAALICQ